MREDVIKERRRIVYCERKKRKLRREDVIKERILLCIFIQASILRRNMGYCERKKREICD